MGGLQEEAAVELGKAKLGAVLHIVKTGGCLYPKRGKNEYYV